MADLRNPRLMYLKAILFVVIGVLSAGLILWDSPNLRTAALLVLAIWAFARAYYFAFYVMERYIDPTYRFAGLVSALRYVLQRRR
jgi:hypothetical protein